MPIIKGLNKNVEEDQSYFRNLKTEIESAQKEFDQLISILKNVRKDVSGLQPGQLRFQRHEYWQKELYRDAMNAEKFYINNIDRTPGEFMAAEAGKQKFIQRVFKAKVDYLTKNNLQELGKQINEFVSLNQRELERLHSLFLKFSTLCRLLGTELDQLQDMTDKLMLNRIPDYQETGNNILYYNRLNLHKEILAIYPKSL